MINLDDMVRMQEIDPNGMLAHIDQLPQQLQQSWELGLSHDLPAGGQIKQVVIAGMGGSAIGGDLVSHYVAPSCTVPITIWRGYGLPRHASGPETLVIASSHSGNTEETLSAFEQAHQRETRIIAVTRGGQLQAQAQNHGYVVWRFEHDGQPRAAVGFSFGLLLALLSRLGLIEDASKEIKNAVEAMRTQQQSIRIDSLVVNNPAKRMAGQLMERWPTIIGAGLLAPVARRWRTQIAELAKAVAQFEVLPEADHNMVAGVEQPEELFGRTMVVFLKCASNHPRNQLRIDITRETMMVTGFNTDVIHGIGDSRLAQQWTCLHFGDYSAYYLAMAYGIDPTPVEAIDSLKSRLDAPPS
jgi:glucose/mannose-6-phosphate isomerase